MELVHPFHSLFCLPLTTYLVTTQAAQPRRLVQAEDGKGNWRVEGMAEGLLSDGWDWTPKQFASDDQTPLRTQSIFHLFSIFY